METRTLIYVGKHQSYSMNNIVMPKGIPITLSLQRANTLPVGDFIDYSPDDFKYPKDVKPLLIKLPRDAVNAIACVPLVERIREFYPITPIVAITNKEYFILYDHIENIELREFYKVKPGNFLKEYDCKISKSSEFFGTMSLVTHTREFCFKQMLNLYPDNSSIPTILNGGGNGNYVLLINHGKVVGSTWVELGNYLSKQEYPFELKVLNNNDSFHNIYDSVINAKYIICTGDSDYAYLAAYYGVPIFIFLSNNTSIYLNQLYKFNNVKEQSIIYSAFIFNKPKEELRDGLIKLIESKLADKNFIFRPEKTNSRKIISLSRPEIKPEIKNIIPPDQKIITPEKTVPEKIITPEKIAGETKKFVPKEGIPQGKTRYGQ